MDVYQPLSRQQNYVLAEVYCRGRRDPEDILDPCSCSRSDCQCLHVEGEIRTAFERKLKEARDSKMFCAIFACWNGDGEILGLFGTLADGVKDQSHCSCCLSCPPYDEKIVLLGEYALKGAVPSYLDRLEKLRDHYRAYWPGRLVLVMMLIAGIYLLIPVFSAIVPPRSDIPPFNAALSPFVALVTGVGTACLQHSIQKYLLLRQRPPA